MSKRKKPEFLFGTKHSWESEDTLVLIDSELVHEYDAKHELLINEKEHPTHEDANLKSSPSDDNKDTNDADNESPNTKPEKKYRVMHMLGLPGNTNKLKKKLQKQKLVYQVMMQIHAESTGTARADTTPRASYPPSSISGMPWSCV